MPPTNDQRPAVEWVKPPEAVIKVANPIMRWLLGSPLHGLVDKHSMLLPAGLVAKREIVAQTIPTL